MSVLTEPETLVVRTGRSPGPELRWCIRSLTWALSPARLVTYGCNIPWLDCEQVVVEQSGPKHDGAYQVLRAILDDNSLPSRVPITDDDMFALDRVGQMPAHHCGPVAEVVRRSHGWSVTVAALGTDVLCRDLHIPTEVDRRHLAHLLDDLQPSVRIKIWWRTLAGGGLTFHEDVKVRDEWTVPNGDWVSTSPTAWQGATGDWLRQRFPEPCEWETA